MNSVSVFSPAKLNLFLAVTGRRPDGFHELVSVVVPLDFGDRLLAEGGDLKSESEFSGIDGFSLECGEPGVPLGETNLVLKAARAFRETTGWGGVCRFILEKRIPMGAGLGGGSSNAAAALRALNTLAGEPLGAEALAGLAAKVGSDCALFLQPGPAVMRGRGERVEPLDSPQVLARLRGRRLVVFKPGFGISTAAAYGALAAAHAYLPAAEAEARLAAWIEDPAAPAEGLLFNSFERVAFAKYVALPVLLERLRERFGVSALMTGSGSACFALLRKDAPSQFRAIAEAIREAWGSSAFVAEATVG